MQVCLLRALGAPRWGERCQQPPWAAQIPASWGSAFYTEVFLPAGGKRCRVALLLLVSPQADTPLPLTAFLQLFKAARCCFQSKQPPFHCSPVTVLCLWPFSFCILPRAGCSQWGVVLSTRGLPHPLLTLPSAAPVCGSLQLLGPCSRGRNSRGRGVW